MLDCFLAAITQHLFCVALPCNIIFFIYLISLTVLLGKLFSYSKPEGTLHIAGIWASCACISVPGQGTEIQLTLCCEAGTHNAASTGTEVGGFLAIGVVGSLTSQVVAEILSLWRSP